MIMEHQWQPYQKKFSIAGWRQGLRKNCQNSTKSAHRTCLTLETCPNLAKLFLGCDQISPNLSGTCTPEHSFLVFEPKETLQALSTTHN